jgi:hypothetical protein
MGGLGTLTSPAAADPGNPPTITESISCADGKMTVSLLLEGTPLDELVYVYYRNGRGGGSNRVMTDPATFVQTAPTMQPIRMWVEHNGTTIHDTDERYLAEDGTCGLETPPLGQGITWSMSSACTATGVRFTLDVDTDQALRRYWMIEDESWNESQLYSGPAQHHYDVPLGHRFTSELSDAWNRQLHWMPLLVATGSGTCAAAPEVEVAPAVEVACREGKPWGRAGATNTGNALVDPSVTWYVDGSWDGDQPDEYHFEDIAPGETRWFDLGPVAAGALVEVSVYASEHGSSVSTDTMAPDSCPDEAPVVGEPTGETGGTGGADGPGVPGGQGAVPPGGSPGDPAPAPAMVASAGEGRQALPRTGMGLAASAGLAVVLLAGGQALLTVSRRRTSA